MHTHTSLPLHAHTQEYVLQRNRAFVGLFVQNLFPDGQAAGLPLEHAFQQTVSMLGANQQQQQQQGAEGLYLRFSHRCK